MIRRVIGWVVAAGLVTSLAGVALAQNEQSASGQGRAVLARTPRVSWRR